MTTLSFPISLAWEALAEMPHAADAYSWDDSCVDPEFEPDLAARINAYSDSLAPALHSYLTSIGFTIGDTGVIIRNEQAIHTANALFNQILFEYDEPDCPRIEVERHGHKWQSTPTWALFGLGGDDDVDYNGSQPSCLTELLLAQCKA